MGRPAHAAAVLGTLAVLAAAGCGGGSDDRSTKGSTTGNPVPTQLKNGGTLRVAMPAEPDYLDPALLQSGEAWQVMLPMCQGLYKITGKGEAAPQLAVGDPVLSDGGKTATIKLRTGVEFNDGTRFDAAAVKASLLRNHKSSVLFRVIPLEQVETPSSDTVVLRLTSPYAPLKADLSGPGGMIASPAQVRRLGQKFGNHPVCVGPFEFVSRKAGDSITLRRSAHYYDPKAVHVDQLFFKVMVDPEARTNALRSGALQIAPEPSGVEQLKSDSQLRVTSLVTAGWTGLYFNIGNAHGVGKPLARRNNPLSTSVVARQALNRAVDRQAILALDGDDDGARVSCSVISTASAYYDNPPCDAKADPTAAKKMLDDAGIKTPIDAKYVVASKPDQVREAQAVQAMARQAGINLKIQTCDVASCIKRLLAGDFDVTQGKFDGFPDPDVSISPFVATGGGFNFIGYSNRKLDELLAQARAESADQAKRKELYKQALQIVREQAPIVVFNNPSWVVAARKDVGGYVVTPSEIVDYSGAGFAQG